MKTKRLLSILASVALTAACTDNKNDSFVTPVSGYYKITSFESTVAVDMNNDGIKSTDLYMEITSAHMNPDSEPLSFYDFESPGNFMEVRPLEGQENNAKLIALNVPDQRMDQLSSGQHYFESYFHSFIHYSYELNDRSNRIDLINNNPAFVENGSLNTLELQTDGSLKLEMAKQLFDFVGLNWVEADVTIIYKKVE